MNEFNEARELFRKGRYKEVVDRSGALIAYPEGRLLVVDSLMNIGGKGSYKKIIGHLMSGQLKDNPHAILVLACLYDKNTQFADVSLNKERLTEDLLAGELYRKAFEGLLEMANEGRDTLAMRKVAQFYEMGAVVKRDLNESYCWYKKSFAGGAFVSANELMLLHSDKNSPFFDVKMANFYYQKAIEHGVLCSQVPEVMKNVDFSNE